MSGSIRYSNLTKALLICFLLLLVPLMDESSDFQATGGRFLALAAGLLFFLSLQQFEFTKSQLSRILLIILAGIFVEALYGWWQFLDGLLNERLNSAPQARPFGVFQQPNVMASFLTTGVVLSGFLLAYDSKNLEINKRHIFYIVFPFVAVHLLHALSSRTGWLGFFAGLLLVLPLMWRAANRVSLGLWITSLLLGFSISWLTIPSSGWQAPEKEIVSLQGLRTTILPQTFQMILDRPLAGYGYGKFESAYINYTAAQHAQQSDFPSGVLSLTHPHNELIFWAVEGGILALATLLAAAYFVWRRVYRAEIRTRLAWIGLFFPIVLHSQLELPFYHSAAHFVIFIILIYWVDNDKADYKFKNIGGKPLLVTAALVIPVITTAFMLTSVQAGKRVFEFETGQNTDIAALRSLRNSLVWEDKIDWAINSRMILSGITTGKPELVQEFVDWVPQLIEREPRPIYFQYLIIAYQFLGQTEEVLAVQREAHFLFPREKFEISDIAAALVVAGDRSSEI